MGKGDQHPMAAQITSTYHSGDTLGAGGGWNGVEHGVKLGLG